MTDSERAGRLPEERKEVREMARNIGNALAEGRIKNPYRVWKLDPPCQLGKMWYGKKPENT